FVVFIFLLLVQKKNEAKRKHAGATPPLDPASKAVYIFALEEVRVHANVCCSLCPVLGAKASRGASCAAPYALLCFL
ncbi:MAG: hypothetical protein J6M62_11890, partial [Selenomonadaceae bacterium]|nr:hypothetical protein [Selenomonadaceae bacterium]